MSAVVGTYSSLSAHLLAAVRLKTPHLFSALSSESVIHPIGDGQPPAGSATSDADADATLAISARAGDRSACESLMIRHQGELVRLLWRFAKNHADLEDLVQETFLRMMKHLPSWRAERPFGHWLRRIAVNVGRDYYRRQSVRNRWMVTPAASALGEAAPEAPEAIDRGPDPAARTAANEMKALLARLSPDDRTLLTLHYLEGWSLSQVAAELGWTVTATKLRAWRARSRLRDTLTSKDLL